MPTIPLPAVIAPDRDRGVRQVVLNALLLLLLIGLEIGAVAMFFSGDPESWVAVPAGLLVFLAMCGAGLKTVNSWRLAAAQAAPVTIDADGVTYDGRRALFAEYDTVTFRVRDPHPTELSSQMTKELTEAAGVEGGERYLIFTGRSEDDVMTFDLSADFGWQDWARLTSVLAPLASQRELEVRHEG